jgi:hypothetical protein
MTAGGAGSDDFWLGSAYKRGKEVAPCDDMWFNGGMEAHTTTHEQYIQAVRDIVIADALVAERITAEQADKLTHTKLVYGLGDGSYRGICHYGAWENGHGPVEAVEIAAIAEESWVQLAGTTIHELGHVLAGVGSGHGAEWKRQAALLGFVKQPEAAGQKYCLALMRPTIRREVHALAQRINDGSPTFARGASWLGILLPSIKPCSAGIGARGGRSRGKGSGSRLRLYECQCATHDGRPGPYKVRIASDTFSATCHDCGAAFERQP